MILRIGAWPGDQDALTALRAAVAQRDGAAVRAALEGRELDAVLQLAGDRLLAVSDDPLARGCAARVRRRGLEGDAELADALERQAGELRLLAVDVEELRYPKRSSQPPTSSRRQSARSS